MNSQRSEVVEKFGLSAAIELVRSLPGVADLSKGARRGARLDAIGTLTADGPPLSEKEKNGLLTLRGNRDGGIPIVFDVILPPVPWCLSTIGCVFCAAPTATHPAAVHSAVTAPGVADVWRPAVRVRLRALPAPQVPRASRFRVLACSIWRICSCDDEPPAERSRRENRPCRRHRARAVPARQCRPEPQ